MNPESIVTIEIISPEEGQYMSNAVCRALWALVSSPNFFSDDLTPQRYAALEANFLDQNRITITEKNLETVIAYGATLKASASEALTSNSPPIEFEI